eukprot:gnl/MRDRNA2_/MRDRNA2_75728_c0_seq1.p1 gnl/MRDRNA2_/MRDRNA2_75728_c0~~gnl/MRDRNA2_/MRDRNA2_75728_c0_seq1.p1  ORF type:complete len:649 (-),score=75.71 gnl/MRDRNA2_/MRDRNA2_75728_c0_seq1:32-1978(-)
MRNAPFATAPVLCHEMQPDRLRQRDRVAARSESPKKRRRGTSVSEFVRSIENVPRSVSPYRRPKTGDGASNRTSGSRDGRDHHSPVEVFVRIRPRLQREQIEPRCVYAENGSFDAPTSFRSVRVGARNFEFEGVFDSSSSDHNCQGQEHVFKSIGAPMARSAMDGFHTCVFALGQTGTGKTYTVFGTPQDPGLVPRILQHVFGNDGDIGNASSGVTCRLSFLEIHVDRLRDLLVDPDLPADDREARGPLELRCNPLHGVYVTNLSEIEVSDLLSAERLVATGCATRSVARTGMNSASSRGHAVFQLEFETGARLCVVDLAGRESERTTLCRGAALAELGYINKSLFHLKEVIQALSKRAGGAPTTRVPFRNSKLTLLLSECLQGARTYVVATIGPTVGSIDETLATLRLAQAVRMITTSSRRHSRPEPPPPLIDAPLIHEVKAPEEEAQYPHHSSLLLPSSGPPPDRPIIRCSGSGPDSPKRASCPASPVKSKTHGLSPMKVARSELQSHLAPLDVAALRLLVASGQVQPCPLCNCVPDDPSTPASREASTRVSLGGSSKSWGSSGSSSRRSVGGTSRSGYGGGHGGWTPVSQGTPKSGTPKSGHAGAHTPKAYMSRTFQVVDKSNVRQVLEDIGVEIIQAPRLKELH